MRQDARRRSLRALAGGDWAVVVALGSFLSWNCLAFRTVITPLLVIPLPFLSYPRTDEGWLGALASMLVTLLVILMVTRAADARTSELTAGTETKEHPDSSRNSRMMLVCGTVLMTLGSIGLLFNPTTVALVTGYGAICGIGMALLLFSWLSGVKPHEAHVFARRMTAGFLLAGAFDGVVALLSCLPWPTASLFICLLPVVTCICLLRDEDDAAVVPMHRSDFLNVDCITLFLSMSGFTLFMGIIGFESDSLSSEDLLLSQVSIMAIAAVAAALLTMLLSRLSSKTTLLIAIPLLLSTALVSLPFTVGTSFMKVSIILDQTTLLMTIMFLVVIVRSRYGSAHFRQQVSCFLAIAALASLLGILSGGAIRSIFGLNTTIIALTALFVVYLIFLVIVMLFKKGDRVEYVISGSVASEAEIADIRTNALTEQYPAISAREREVLCLMLQNYGNTRIADKLTVSENTVKTHVRHIYSKMGINSRQQLFAIAESIQIEESDTANSTR